MTLVLRPRTEIPNGISKLLPERATHCQVANTSPKLTARDVYAMVRNRKEEENPDFSSVAATFEKAITYVFAGKLIRNAEVVGSNPICSTSNPLMIKNLDDQRFQRRFSVSPIYANFF